MQTLRQPLITNSKQPYVVSVHRMSDFLLHCHDELELMFVLSGELIYTIDGKQYDLHPGDAVLITPNLIHGVRTVPGTDPPQGLLVECGYTLFGEDYSLIRGKYLETPLLNVLSGEDPVSKQLNGYLEALLREADVPPEERSPASGVAIRGLICGLFVFLVRELPLLPITDAVLSQSQRMRWSTLFDFIAVHSREPIRIEQAASLAGYSVYHFSRVFREYTGVSFHRYLNRYRIERASLLLTEPEITVTQVAEQSGFESIKTFNRVFRQMTGSCPSEFRAQQQASSTQEASFQNP